VLQLLCHDKQRMGDKRLSKRASKVEEQTTNKRNTKAKMQRKHKAKSGGGEFFVLSR